MTSANKTSFPSLVKNNFTTAHAIYFASSFLYLYWVLSTYRNIVHMDMMNILSTKIKDLYEHQLTGEDFIYQSLFPCSVSLSFTFLNCWLFHLNSVVETVCGSLFLVMLGYKYINGISIFIPGKKEKLLFAGLISFLLFGLHKWEAAFTSFFSFSVFFTLCICFFNYFFVFSYIDKPGSTGSKYQLAFFILSNLLVIFEAPAYFYSYILSILIILFFMRRLRIAELNIDRWKTIFRTCLLLLVFTLALTTMLSRNPVFVRVASAVSIKGFIQFFFQHPIWCIKFYLVAHSGAFAGEAYNFVTLRVLLGFVILISYLLAIYHVIKTKDKRLLVPAALILYNIISCGFITMSRYTFNVVEYGSASRYTAFHLSGVVGLATILFFILMDHTAVLKKYLSGLVLALILICYLYVDWRQFQISPSRTIAFENIKTALLTAGNLEVLQAKKETSLQAIAVLKKYRLNVYYNNPDTTISTTVKLANTKQVILATGTPEFNKAEKMGFYGDENGINWTNGKASLLLNPAIEPGNSVVVEMNTYMPPICNKIVPKLTLWDEHQKEYTPVRTDRQEDRFYFFFNGLANTSIRRITITSDTINAFPDKRILSFPFKGLTLKATP